MLDAIAHRVLARLAPLCIRGGTLHRRALAAAAAGHFVDAEQLFEVSAACYRRQLQIEALARLRVHQHMARARSGDAAAEAEQLLEIVRRVSKLDRLEAYDTPHELLDAREALARWLGEQAVPEDAGADFGPSLAAAA